MSTIDPPAGWDEVDGINTNERLLGGPSCPLNRAVTGLTARTKQLRGETAVLSAQAADLAQRDEWLKAEIASNQEAVDQTITSLVQDLGSAAYSDSSQFATAQQGATAESAFSGVEELVPRVDALVAGQTTSMLYFESVSQMNATPGSFVNQGGFVPSVGQFRWTGSAWQKIADDTLADKASKSSVEALEKGDFTAKSDFKFTELAPESGYAYALVDRNDSAALLVSTTGQVWIPNLDLRITDGYVQRQMLDAQLSSMIATPLSYESGWVYVLTDSMGRCAFGVKTDGTVWANGIQLESPYAPNSNIRALGDSLTEASVSYRTQLLPFLINKNRTIYNDGIGGQNSQQIASRSGAISTLAGMNVGNSYLDSSGSTLVVPSTVRPLSAPSRTSGVSSLKGWVEGVYGTLACAHAPNSSDDTYTFTRDSTGARVYCIPGTPWRPEIGDKDKSLSIIWMGTNNIGQVQTIINDYKKVISGINSSEPRFILLTPINSSPVTAGVAPDISHVPDAIAVESALTLEYGDRVLNVRPWLAQFSNGSADDQSDVLAGCVPRSLKIDAVHLSSVAQGYIAEWIAQQINYRGW